MFFTRPRVGYIKNIILWLGIFCLLILVYAFRFELSSIKERVIAVLVPSYSWTNNSGQLVIARSSNGHFYLDAVGSKNQVIHFLVDNGKSNDVILKQNYNNHTIYCSILNEEISCKFIIRKPLIFSLS